MALFNEIEKAGFKILAYECCSRKKDQVWVRPGCEGIAHTTLLISQNDQNPTWGHSDNSENSEFPVRRIPSSGLSFLALNTKSITRNFSVTLGIMFVNENSEFRGIVFFAPY